MLKRIPSTFQTMSGLLAYPLTASTRAGNSGNLGDHAIATRAS